jgi:glycosyltransferase involved in cell wall biosynthesis
LTGYGNDAVDMAVHLERLGHDVLPWPVNTMAGLPREFTDLLTKDPSEGRNADAVLMFAPPFQIQPWEFKIRDVPAFGYSMWERTPLLRTDFDWPIDKPIGWAHYGLAGMAVTTAMNIGAFEAIDRYLPMTVVPCGIDPDDWPVLKRPDHPAEGANRPFRFLMHGALAGRKNPFAVFGAWRDLKQRHPDCDAELWVHSYSMRLHPSIADVYGSKGTNPDGGDIWMFSDSLPYREVLDMFHQCDVLVSPSRGEGNNKPAMQMLSTGGAVLASDWSGHQNWLDAPGAYPLRGKLIPAFGAAGAEEFEVDHDSLVERMYLMWARQDHVREEALAGAQWIRDYMTWPRLLPNLVDWMAELSG